MDSLFDPDQVRILPSIFIFSHLPSHAWSCRVSGSCVLPLQPSPSRDEEQNRVAVSVGRALRVVTMLEG